MRNDAGERIGPRCIHGHAAWCDGFGGDMSDALRQAGISLYANDEEIVRDKKRISWAEYRRRANIQRAER
jgi:hypothetical protein